MRIVFLLVFLATPLWAETPEPPTPSDVAAPTCSSCDARKAGLKKLKAARGTKTNVPEPEDG
ncbi:MAG: hypothetical protein AB3N13_08450 [Arenibacterium sp.]